MEQDIGVITGLQEQGRGQGETVRVFDTRAYLLITYASTGNGGTTRVIRGKLGNEVIQMPAPMLVGQREGDKAMVGLIICTL